MLPLLVPLFVSAFRRADELAMAMEARCYRGGRGQHAHAAAALYQTGRSGRAVRWAPLLALAVIRALSRAEGRTIPRGASVSLVEYDGTDYSGWQRQENALSRAAACWRKRSPACWARKPCVIGASRTDAGVHALGQIAMFDTKSGIPAEKFAFALNTMLPADIRVRASEECAPDFHARYSGEGQDLSLSDRQRAPRQRARTAHPRALDLSAGRVPHGRGSPEHWWARMISARSRPAARS